MSPEGQAKSEILAAEVLEGKTDDGQEAVGNVVREDFVEIGGIGKGDGSELIPESISPDGEKKKCGGGESGNGFAAVAAAEANGGNDQQSHQNAGAEVMREEHRAQEKGQEGQ